MSDETRRRAKRRRSAIGIESTYLGICIGARSVSMTLAHVDPPDHLLRIRERTVPFALARRHTPSMVHIKDGLQRCWEGFEGLEARRTAVLIPSWCSSAVPVTGRLPIRRAGWADPDGVAAPVTQVDVRRLADTVCREGVPPGKAVTGLACERYVLGGQFTVDDPVAAITTDLEMHGHLFVADPGVARGVLELLQGLGIEADILATPLSALSALLLERETARESILVEISQRHSACGLFRLGRPVRLAEAPWGTDDILAGLAGRLAVDEGSIARCLFSKRDWMLDPEVFGAQFLHLTAGRTSLAATVAEVDAALAASALPLVSRIQAALEGAAGGSDPGPPDVAVIGDCPVLMRAVAVAGNRATSLRWIPREVPERHRDHVDPAILDRTRMAGALRLASLGIPDIQPCLDDFHGGPIRPAFDDAVAGARRAGRRLAGLWSTVRPYMWLACEHAARGIQRIPAALRAIRPSAMVRPPAASG